MADPSSLNYLHCLLFYGNIGAFPLPKIHNLNRYLVWMWRPVEVHALDVFGELGEGAQRGGRAARDALLQVLCEVRLLFLFSLIFPITPRQGPRPQTFVPAAPQLVHFV